MGCSNSIVFDFDKFNPFNLFKDEDKNTQEPFEVRKEKYLKIQEITNLIISEDLLEIAEKLIDKKTDQIKAGMSKIWEKNSQKFSDNSISRESYEKAFYCLLSELLIKNDYLKSDQNLVKNFEKFLQAKNLLSDFENQKTFEILYDPIMDLASHERVMNMFSPKDEEEEEKTYKILDQKILENLVYKLTYDDNILPSAVFLHVNNENLKSDIIPDFCEAISHNEKLSFISIILDPITIDIKTNKKYLYSLNPLMYRNLYKIIEAVGKNDNIKHFILTSTYESNIILAPEISNLIVNKLNSDTLLGFYIGKFLIPESTLRNIFNSLSSLNKLKYFCFDIRKFNKQLVDCFKENIVRNKSLELVGIFGFKYPEKEYEQLKKDLKRNYYLKILLNKENVNFE